VVSRVARDVDARPSPTIDLADESSRSPHVAGAKAAALARARAAGLPVLDGYVLTVSGAERFRRKDPAVDIALRNIWSIARTPAVVRSSSTVEDQGSSSMAGMFTSVLGVDTWDQFLSAIERVLASAGDAPMAVLIQPQLDAVEGGVMFGLDPVTGRRDRLMVATVDGGPDALVSGRMTGSRTTLTLYGRRLDAEGDGPRLSRSDAHRLATLAAKAADAFGGPQDVEWAIDRAGRLWLLQSRPITAATSGAPLQGPVLGPGPVAETFPDPLSYLELDLWLRPLEEALREVLPLVGAASRRSVAKSPLVVEVGGRVAIDLQAIGAIPRRGFIARLDPRPSLRRLGAGWRVGRLRAALPALAGDVIAQVDVELMSFPDPATLPDEQLLEVLETSSRVLVAIHGHELMAGLVSTEEPSGSGAAAALRELALGRRKGLSDLEILSLYPSTLGLVPPRIGGDIRLPDVPERIPSTTHDASGLIGAREELRARARLVQELGGRVAMELGKRLAAKGVLADARSIRWAHLHELPAIFEGAVVPLSLEDRVPEHPTPSLPATFRLNTDGEVVQVAVRRKAKGDGGQGVSSGRAEGIAYDGTGEPPAGAILVVRNLDPALAPLLPRLTGLVAETGSVLSHLAILAREFGLPTVVDVPDAMTRFVPGTKLVIDGSTGDIGVATPSETT
jgi:phosphohistidine swiveling domain-containing protein